jgi:LmbE family N-acetylglucosaminyl deacetylase
VNILAIGAHPDDVELGCGGLLLEAARQGQKIFLYVITAGSASGDAVARTREQIETAKFIGARTLWIDDFEDTKLSLNVELISHIEYVMNRTQPDVVYTHPLGDTHHDHRAVAEATLEAGRFVPNILSYETPLTKDFNAQVYYDISDFIDDKIELLSVFSSQNHKMCLKSHAIRGLAQYRTLESGLSPSVTSVEFFEVLKLGLGNDFQMLTSCHEEIPPILGHNNRLTQEIFEWTPKEHISLIP